MRGIDMLNAPSRLSKLLAHSSDTHAYPTKHVTRGLLTVPKSRTDYGRWTVLNRAMTTWNSISHQVAHASSKIRLKQQIKKTPYGTAGNVKQHKHRHRHMHTHTHTIAYALWTHVNMDFVLYIQYVVVGAWGNTVCDCIVMFFFNCINWLHFAGPQEE